MNVFPADDMTRDARALDLARMAEPRGARRELQALLEDVERAGGQWPALVPALEALCRGVGRLTGGESVDVWMHERNAHQLVCVASSNAAHRSLPAISTTDCTSPLSRALRREAAQLDRLDPAAGGDAAPDLTVPLRGRRRALGVLVLQHLKHADPSAICDSVAEVGSQLSSILENAQLLDDVLRSRQELESLAEAHATLERRLRQSEKLLALSQFVAGIAHELNNPLQGVLGHVELLQASTAVPESLRRDLQTIYREADRAARIVKDLLVFAGSGRLRRRNVAINAVVMRVLRLRAAALKSAGVDVERELADDLPAVSGDPLLLQQVLMNAVVNAEQAMAGPGRLMIRTTTANAMVVVSVEDTGPGLPADVKARLFEPFFTTKEVGSGTGLGLSIAYGIVQAHGGTIEAVNRDGGGARIAIALPALATARAKPPKRAGSNPRKSPKA
jgi:signal transduction histidine kinase